MLTETSIKAAPMKHIQLFQTSNKYQCWPGTIQGKLDDHHIQANIIFIHNAWKHTNFQETDTV